MKRTFIAIEIKAGAALTDLLSRLKTEMKTDQVKWVDPQQMHITLAFLGDTEENQIREATVMVENAVAGIEEFNFRIRGLGIFRNINDPRVIWAGTESPEKLKGLSKPIKQGLQGIGIQTEDRPFNPHLTLGRIKQIRKREVLEKFLKDYSDCVLQDVAVKEIIFLESILRPSGPVYIPLSVFRLK